jgi:prepilin peptidase CpaA
MMEFLTTLAAAMVENWPIWFVTIVLIVAAVIDGLQLRVPNWLTYPMIISGWIFSIGLYAVAGEPWYHGLGWSLLGTLIGLACLLPAYSIGGMGAGDVKLMMGVGAWVHGETTWYAFCVTAVVGAVLAVLMTLCRGAFMKHYLQFKMIFSEILTIRDPERLSTIAAERKSSMMLLPYGIPIAIGTIGYFAWMGMLI